MQCTNASLDFFFVHILNISAFAQPILVCLWSESPNFPTRCPFCLSWIQTDHVGWIFSFGFVRSACSWMPAWMNIYQLVKLYWGVLLLYSVLAYASIWSVCFRLLSTTPGLTCLTGWLSIRKAMASSVQCRKVAGSYHFFSSFKMESI